MYMYVDIRISVYIAVLASSLRSEAPRQLQIRAAWNCLLWSTCCGRGMLRLRNQWKLSRLHGAHRLMVVNDNVHIFAVPASRLLLAAPWIFSTGKYDQLWTHHRIVVAFSHCRLLRACSIWRARILFDRCKACADTVQHILSKRRSW